MINRDKSEFIVGVFLVLLPLSGLPTFFKTIFTIVLGGVIIYFAIDSLERKRKREREQDEKNLANKSFVESHPEKIENQENI